MDFENPHSFSGLCCKTVVASVIVRDVIDCRLLFAVMCGAKV